MGGNAEAGDAAQLPPGHAGAGQAAAGNAGNAHDGADAGNADAGGADAGGADAGNADAGGAGSAAAGQPAIWVRAAAALIGLASLGVGVYAVTETANQAGAAALVVVAGIFLLLSLNFIPFDRSSSGEALSNVVLALLVLACAGAGWALEPAVTATAKPPAVTAQGKPLPAAACQNSAGTVARRGAAPVTDRVSNAASTLVISVGRQGAAEQRESSPLPIQGGNIRFKPGASLCTAASDFIRSDGQVLPGYQLASKALVSNDGQDVTIRVYVAPRYQQVSGFGEYSGTVSLDDAQATGALVHVTIYIQYPYINRVLLLGLLLSCAGLIWGLLVRSADIDSTAQHVRGSERFFANLALRVAVLATAVPIINAQVLSDPGWTGTLSDYIRLGSLVGGAAIAATPSLRAIVSNLGPRP